MSNRVKVINGHAFFPVRTIFKQRITDNHTHDYRCMAFAYLNQGNTTAQIDGVYNLSPGLTYSDSNDIFTWTEGQHTIIFLDDAPEGETAKNAVVIIEKYIDVPEYTDLCKYGQ